MMYSSIMFRSGSVSILAEEYVQMVNKRESALETKPLENADTLMENNILAVHYADGGAQGEPGAVYILYNTKNGVEILYGNYAYGKLNLDTVINKLPMLRSLDSRYSINIPYPFGGSIDIPAGWAYLYMGAMNHFFVRKGIADMTETFLRIIHRNIGKWESFNAVAWFCGANRISEAGF